MPQYHLNPSLFFMLTADGILVWNYKDHEQFLLNSDYFQVLQTIAEGGEVQEDSICQELLAGKLILTKPVKMDEWGWDELAKIYHIGTSDVRQAIQSLDSTQFSQEYLDICEQFTEQEINFFQEKPYPIISLPEPEVTRIQQTSLFDVLKNRKTCRNFNGASISIEELSTLLYFSFGLIHGDWDELKKHDLKEVSFRKASPSGGGIHPEEAYVVAYRVDGLDAGLYYYRPQDHKLNIISKDDFEEKVIEMNFQQFFSQGLSIGIYITARFDKSWWKYSHSRGYRAVLLDVGHASQTLQLTATALGYHTWLTAAYADSQVKKFLELDNPHEHPLLFVGIGKGTGKAIPEKMLAELQSRS